MSSNEEDKMQVLVVELESQIGRLEGVAKRQAIFQASIAIAQSIITSNLSRLDTWQKETAKAAVGIAVDLYRLTEAVCANVPKQIDS